MSETLHSKQESGETQNPEITDLLHELEEMADLSRPGSECVANISAQFERHSQIAPRLTEVLFQNNPLLDPETVTRLYSLTILNPELSSGSRVLYFSLPLYFQDQEELSHLAESFTPVSYGELLESTVKKSETMRRESWSLLNRAQTETNGINGEGQDNEAVLAQALSDLAENVYQCGQLGRASQLFDQARSVASHIRFQDAKINSLSDLAEAMARSGPPGAANEVFSQVCALTNTIEPDSWRLNTQSILTGAMARSGVISQDQVAMIRDHNESTSFYTLLDIADAMACRGETEDANYFFIQAEKKIIETGSGYRHTKFSNLLDLAMALAQNDQMEKAEEYFAQAQTIIGSVQGYSRNNVRQEFATALARVGLFDQARNEINQINSNHARSIALRDLANAMAKNGLIDEVLEIEGEIGNDYAIYETLCLLAESLARSGRTDEADSCFNRVDEYINSIANNNSHRANTLCLLAESLARSGREERADEVLNRVREIMNDVEGAHSRAEVFSTLALTLFKISQVVQLPFEQRIIVTASLIESCQHMQTESVPDFIQAELDYSDTFIRSDFTKLPDYLQKSLKKKLGAHIEELGSKSRDSQFASHDSRAGRLWQHILRLIREE